MAKSLKEVLAGIMLGPSPGWAIKGADADALIAGLAKEGWFILNNDPYRDQERPTDPGRPVPPHGSGPGGPQWQPPKSD